MEDGKPTERMNELLASLQQAVQALGTGSLSAEGLEQATAEAQALYERLVVLRHKMRERAQAKPAAPVEPPPAQPEMPALKLDTRPAEPVVRQTSLIDAIAETENEGGRRKPKRTTPAPGGASAPAPPVPSTEHPLPSSRSSLADRLEHAPIKDLHKAIALSQKFWFVAELFGGQRERYERTIDALNAAPDLDSAKAVVKEVEAKLSKPPSDDVLKIFTELVERRFRT